MILQPWNSAGSRNKNAKLNEQLVQEIRSAYRAWQGGRQEFLELWAKRAGVHPTSLKSVLYGYRWKEVSGTE